MTMFVFFEGGGGFDEGRKDPDIQIPLKAGYHQPASKKPFKWRFAEGPIMARH